LSAALSKAVLTALVLLALLAVTVLPACASSSQLASEGDNAVSQQGDTGQPSTPSPSPEPATPTDEPDPGQSADPSTAEPTDANAGQLDAEQILQVSCALPGCHTLPSLKKYHASAAEIRAEMQSMCGPDYSDLPDEQEQLLVAYYLALQ
jgi:hypothetical protein